MVAGDWESVFGRLQELVLANSGEDDFQEIFKLVVAKLVVELDGDRLPAPSEVDALLAEACTRWPGILPAGSRSLLAAEHLRVCLDALAGVRLLDAGLEVMDSAFEHLVSRTAKGAKGQYFTPRHVIDACVRIVKPRDGETVADPACGSAGFLVHAAGSGGARSLWGYDFDQRAVQVAHALLLIAGHGGSRIARVNSLLPGAIEGSFDVILTNPPFAGDVREPELLASYELARARGRTERDVLFLERCVELLRPGGRLAIVLPHNKFAASQWGFAREWLLRRMRVVGVLGLGRHTFQPHTGQKASVLFAQKRAAPVDAAPRDERALFMVSEREGKDARGRVIPRPGALAGAPMWERADHDLGDCVARFDAFASGEDGLSGWRAAA
jgi:type I restriction enzyme M protein